jgi:hypothetical protein
LGAGEIGFESDTNKFKIGTGSTAWVSLPYASNVSPLTTKGDLYTYSTDNARLAVGANGETLVADSSTTTGLRYQAPKTQNALYNSSFDIAQRGTSFTGLAATDYTLDRWMMWSTTAGQSNYASQQSVGNLSVTPNQATRFCGRFGRTSGTSNTGARQVFQTLETNDSIRFAGKTITFSFYARAGANYSSTGNGLQFGVTSGTGTDQIYYSFSGPAAAIGTNNVTLTAAWQRFTATGTVATNATQLGAFFIFTPTGTAGADDFFEITGAQLEEGSVATPFNRMSGTIQGELAACQRYYYRTATGANSRFGFGVAFSTTGVAAGVQLPVTMRTNVASIDFSTLAVYDNVGAVTAATSVVLNTTAPDYPLLVFTVASGLTQFRPYHIMNDNSSSGYIGFSAEL